MARAKTAKRKMRARNRRVTSTAEPDPSGNRVASHVRMVLDPCYAPLAPTAYRGQDGFLMRTSSTYDLVANPLFGCGVVAYWPRYNKVFLLGLGSDSTTFAMDFYGTAGYAGPGAAFFGTNAAETRPVAACIVSQYVGTELDRQGYISSGVIPYKLVAGSSLTIAGLRQLLQRWQRTPDSIVESKWIPGPDSENYQATPSSLPAIYGDDNIIVHAFSGFAANKMLISNRIVAIQEWQPFWGLGIAAPTPNTNDPPAGLERVRTALAKFGSWWVDAAHTAEVVGRAATQVIGGASTMARTARRVAPLLLTAA